MSAGWNWFIALATVINLAACLWLIGWSSKRRPGEAADHEVTGHKWDGDLEEYNNPLPRWWLMLFYLTLVFGAVYLVIYPGLGSFEGLAGWTQTGQYRAELEAAEQRYGDVYGQFADVELAALATDPDAVRLGEGLFANHCAVCHGAEGRGAQGFPNLTDAVWQYGGTPEAVYASIANGRAGVMPPMAPALGEAGVEEVTAYVLSLSGADADPALAAAGESRYALCAACHGPDGRGNQALGAPDLTDDEWLYGGTAEDIRTGLVNGRNGQMPGHLALLGEDKVRVLTGYVLSLSAGVPVAGGP